MVRALLGGSPGGDEQLRPESVLATMSAAHRRLGDGADYFQYLLRCRLRCAKYDLSSMKRLAHRRRLPAQVKGR